MATYREVKGYSVKSVSSDPANVKEGQIWYNSSTQKIKVAPLIQAWASGDNLNTTRRGIGGAGTQTAGLACAGFVSTFPVSQVTEEYDGSSWTNGNNMGSGHYVAGTDGTQTAAMHAGGYSNPGGLPANRSAAAETYDGTNWSEGPDLNEARYNTIYAGTTTAGVLAGGTGAAPTPYGRNESEDWDGSSWTAGNTIGTARYTFAFGAGTQTAGLIAGGFDTPPAARVTLCEEYNGTSWSEVNNCNTARNNGGMAGIQTAALMFGGSTGSDSAATESYDGTNWTTLGASLATARGAGSSFGTQTAAAYAGGHPSGSNTNVTEEFTDSGATVRTVDVS